MSANWHLSSELEDVDPRVIKYGAGFLNSRPANWVPTFPALWTPLFKLLNLEVAIADLQPTFILPSKSNQLWFGTLEGNKVALSCETFISKYLTSLFVPDMDAIASKVLEDYLARRFFKSLVSSWMGPFFNDFQYYGANRFSDFTPEAGIKITMSFNGRQVTLWLLLEEALLKKLDNLWRRQTTTFNIKKLESRNYQLVYARQQIHLDDLETQLHAGNRIYLKNLDLGNLLMEDIQAETARSVKIYRSQGQLALKLLETEISNLADSTQLLLKFVSPTFALSTEQLELSNSESFLAIGIDIDSRLKIQVSGEVVAEATLSKDADGYFAQILS